MFSGIIYGNDEGRIHKLHVCWPEHTCLVIVVVQYDAVVISNEQDLLFSLLLWQHMDLLITILLSCKTCRRSKAFVTRLIVLPKPIYSDFFSSILSSSSSILHITTILSLPSSTYLHSYHYTLLHCLATTTPLLLPISGSLVASGFYLLARICYYQNQYQATACDQTDR